MSKGELKPKQIQCLKHAEGDPRCSTQLIQSTETFCFSTELCSVHWKVLFLSTETTETSASTWLNSVHYMFCFSPQSPPKLLQAKFSPSNVLFLSTESTETSTSTWLNSIHQTFCFFPQSFPQSTETFSVTMCPSRCSLHRASLSPSRHHFSLHSTSFSLLRSCSVTPQSFFQSIETFSFCPLRFIRSIETFFFCPHSFIMPIEMLYSCP